MRVKIVKPFNGPTGPMKAGDIVDFPPKHAERFIFLGLAKRVRGESTADDSEMETATQKKKSAKKRARKKSAKKKSR